MQWFCVVDAKNLILTDMLENIKICTENEKQMHKNLYKVIKKQY